MQRKRPLDFLNNRRAAAKSNGMDSSSPKGHRGATLEFPHNQLKKKESTMKLIRVGVDLAKNVFQVHGVDRCEKPVWRKKLSRGDWLKTLLERIEPGCEIGMEACGSAHHWARQLQQGVGPIIATAIVANVGDAKQFANGRQIGHRLA
jgi:hypothetical protein